MKTSFEVYQLNKDDINDFKKIITLFKEVFQTKNTTTAKRLKLAGLLNNADFVVLAIKTNKQIIGGLTAYKLKSYYTANDELFLFDIAIKKNYQKKGAGKLLINYLKQYCNTNNIRLMFVEANEEDEHAIQFYTSTANTFEKVIQFNYNIKLMNKG